MYLNEISDDWLICLYREGNQVAADLLFERYNVFLYGFINQVLRKDCIYYEYKELFQELIIVLMNCIERYDEDNGCFYYFVKKAAERKLYNLLSKIARKNRVLSLDDSFYDDGNEDVVDYVKEENNAPYYTTELYQTIVSKLNEEEILILNMKVEGYAYREISKKLGISKQAIYRRVNSIKNIVKDIIEKID